MFGLAAGATGLTLLYTQVNGLTALLGSSMFLYVLGEWGVSLNAIHLCDHRFSD